MVYNKIVNFIKRIIIVNIKKIYLQINTFLYQFLRKIKNLWVRAVVSWFGHLTFALFIAAFPAILGFVGVRLSILPPEAMALWLFGPLGFAVFGWIAGSFYIGKETIRKWPLDRNEVDHFMDAEMPFTGLWWALYIILT